jgi:hypothetical protein
MDVKRQVAGQMPKCFGIDVTLKPHFTHLFIEDIFVLSARFGLELLTARNYCFAMQQGSAGLLKPQFFAHYPLTISIRGLNNE